MKEKIKSYDFWVSVASAVMVLLQTISIKIDVPYVNEITMAFLSLLTVTGILKKSPAKQANVDTAGQSGATEQLPDVSLPEESGCDADISEESGESAAVTEVKESVEDKNPMKEDGAATDGKE